MDDCSGNAEIKEPISALYAEIIPKMRRIRFIFTAINAEINAMYIHQLAKWPDFQWNKEELIQLLGQVRHHQGKLLGRMESMGFSLQSEATLQTLTLDVLKSSEIEGEILNPDQVRSSIARRLG